MGKRRHRHPWSRRAGLMPPHVVNQKKLYASADAQVWAEEFMKVIDSGVEPDEELMIGWFANAMETAKNLAVMGSDNVAQPSQPSVDKQYLKEQAIGWLVGLNDGRSVGIDEILKDADKIVDYLSGEEEG